MASGLALINGRGGVLKGFLKLILSKYNAATPATPHCRRVRKPQAVVKTVGAFWANFAGAPGGGEVSLRFSVKQMQIQIRQSLLIFRC